MIEIIRKQLEIIEKSNNWICKSLEGNKQKDAYRNMVNCRRKLNRKRFALESNPAAAVYGQSQVGKSYLISSLLSEEGNPFCITDENGYVHNFIKTINPPGGGSESTSLVSRFSINFKPINPNFPVKAILMSPADIALVLCDSYYNDINLRTSQNIQFLTSDEINTEIEQLKDRFKKCQQQQQIFCEDDVLDMQDYFDKYFQKADKVIDSKFFYEISQLISKTNHNEWKDIFPLLWNKNEIFTALFAKLIEEFSKLNFSKEVYLPIESVLYAYGTLLDVKRLREIYTEADRIESNYTATTKVLISGAQEIDFPKSYLCALTAELVFNLPETLLKSKPFLKESDLLDFPGARSRMEKPVEAIEHNIIPDLLLRGKVAYLFNKYSDAEKINILIFCAKHELTAQRIIPRILNNWISKVVGDTPEERENFIFQSKISPLFVIGTFFNLNLEYNPVLDTMVNTSSLNYRWLQRFETTMENEYFEKATYKWFENWTISQPDFQNIFLLRDFEKSETPSNIFKGYNEHKSEKEEVKPPNYPNFRLKLRQSFIEYDFVQRHFANPAESWDEAATINKDGTQLIIKQLTIAASNINNARREKTLTELNEILQYILTELRKFFHNDDKDETLKRARSIAGNIQHRLDNAFRADGIKNYGQLMKELILDEASVLQLFRTKVDDIENRDVINMDNYSIYRMHVPVQENETIETYFERLCKHYEKNTDKEKEEFRSKLIADRIDLEELISGNSVLIKNNSQQLADVLLEYWFNYITQNEKHTIQQILAQDNNPSLQDISDMFQKLFKKLNIAHRIAEKIRRYVDGHNKTDLPYEIIADISAEILNKCITTVGFEYLDDSEIHDLFEANKKNDLGLILESKTNPSENSIKELFTKIENWADIIQSNPEAMKSLPSYQNYITWYNRLKIGFVIVCDIPNYDPKANAELGNIIKECETITYQL